MDIVRSWLLVFRSAALPAAFPTTRNRLIRTRETFQRYCNGDTLTIRCCNPIEASDLAFHCHDHLGRNNTLDKTTLRCAPANGHRPAVRFIDLDLDPRLDSDP